MPLLLLLLLLLQKIKQTKQEASARARIETKPERGKGSCFTSGYSDPIQGSPDMAIDRGFLS
jgi:hypothetical protein